MDGPKRDRSGGPGLQITSFDIFQVEAGGVVWRGAATTFEDANERVQELVSASPADYIIWDRNSGEKHAIKSGRRQKGAGTKRTHS
jgi:hypothetical protein